MSAGLLLLPALLALTAVVWFRTRNPFHPLFVLIASFGALALINVAFAEAVSFYPLAASGAGAITIALTALAVGVTVATLAYPAPAPTAHFHLTERLDPGAVYRLSLLLVALFVVSNLLYWAEANRVVGFGAIAQNPARLKAAELVGSLNPNAPAFVFRGALLVPVSLTLAVVLNPDKRLPRLLLVAFLAASLIQVRRDPIVLAYGACLAVAAVTVDRFRRLLIPLGIGVGAFLTLAVGLLALLRSFSISFQALLFGYTAGNLSSFQALLDGYGPEVPRQPFEFALYVFYALFKYLDPLIRPGPVIRQNPDQAMLPNTYTFLADFYADAGLPGLIVFPFVIGLVMGVTYALAIRRPTLTTLCVFAAVYGVTIMSFMNNEWSWLIIPMAGVTGWLATVFLLKPLEAVRRVFRRARERLPAPVTGTSSGTG